MALTTSSVETYLQDASGYRGEAEEVFLPVNTAELTEVLLSAAHDETGVTVAGAGTGLTGARVPHGGSVVSLEKFRTLEIDHGLARCGAGVLLKDLHEAAARTHQFFGPNPTESTASIGGIFSTNAGGARSFHYGSVRRHVLAVVVTFADGETRRFVRGDKVDFPFTPVRIPSVTKNSAGYYLRPDLDWIDLLAGSEGTLAIASEIELQLQPQPPAVLSGVVFFKTDEEAFEAVEGWRSIDGLRLIEYMDEPALDLLRPSYADIPGEARAAILIEQNIESEEDEEVDEWIVRLHSAHALEETSWFGFTPADQIRFRDFRHILPAMVTDTVRRNGYAKFGTDFAVPINRHRELHAFYRQRCTEVLPGQFTIFGHIGDANNHVNLLPRTATQALAAEKLIREFAELVVSMGGTVAAEHGIGKTKTDLLRLMYTPGELQAMLAVKAIVDPKQRLCLGNIFGDWVLALAAEQLKDSFPIDARPQSL